LEITSKLWTQTPRPLGVVARQQHKLALKREGLLNDIRMLPGFERFLLPKSFSQLLPASCSGHIVMFNISEFRCDALVLNSRHADVMHIPLKTFTQAHAKELHQSLKDLLSKTGRCFCDTESSNRATNLVPIDGRHQNPEEELQRILSELWLHVVRPGSGYWGKFFFNQLNGISLTCIIRFFRTNLQ
jgi:hypothetical protein